MRTDLTHGQTQSNYSLAIADELFECVWPLCGIKFERVKSQNHFDICVKPTWWIHKTIYRAYKDILLVASFLFLIWMSLGNQSFSDHKAAFPKFYLPENLVILSHNEMHKLSLMQIQDDDVDYNLKQGFWERLHSWFQVPSSFIF